MTNEPPHRDNGSAEHPGRPGVNLEEEEPDQDCLEETVPPTLTEGRTKPPVTVLKIRTQFQRVKLGKHQHNQEQNHHLLRVLSQDSDIKATTLNRYRQ